MFLSLVVGSRWKIGSCGKESVYSVWARRKIVKWCWPQTLSSEYVHITLTNSQTAMCEYCVLDRNHKCEHNVASGCLHYNYDIRKVFV